MPPSERPAASCKLFLACFPDAASNARLEQRVEALRPRLPGVRWSAPHRRHLTLHFLAVTAAPDPVAIRHAQEVAGRWRGPALDITLDHLRALGHPRRPALAYTASQLPAPLQEGWSRLHHALVSAGFTHEAGRPFVPHLTLAYTATAPELPPVPPLAVHARAFELLLSIAGQADYRHLGRWPLH